MKNGTKWLVGLLAALIATMAGYGVLLKVRQQLFGRWSAQLETRDEVGAHRTAAIIRRIDPSNGGALIAYNDAVEADMHGLITSKKLAAEALRALSKLDWSNGTHARQEELLISKAYLNVLLGDTAKSKEQAVEWCNAYRPHQPSLRSCLSYSLKFMSYNPTHHSAIEIYALAKLSKAIDPADDAWNNVYEVLSLSVIDPDRAAQLHEKLVRMGEFDQSNLKSFCDYMKRQLLHATACSYL